MGVGIVRGSVTRNRKLQPFKLERIEIKAVPWSSSRIVVKGNKRHTKFDYYQVRKNDFDALLKELNVPLR